MKFSLRTTLAVLVLLLVSGISTGLQAADPPLLDIVHLRNGGRIVGHAQEITENKQKMYLVETEDGAVIKLRNNQVRRIERPSPELRDYLEAWWGSAGSYKALSTTGESAADVVSYTFYRLECAVRAAAVLSFVGLGGLGLRVTTALDDLAF